MRHASGRGVATRGVVSPILNIFLHYVLDEWFERDAQPRLKGRSFLIRYADDFVMGFSCEEDARRVMDVLPKRFEKYGLTIHPEKTRLVPFERPDRVPDRTDPERRQPPGSFDLLGFTHYWARSRNGNWVVKRKTSTSRFRRGLQALSRWCQINRHQPLATQHQTLKTDGALRVLRDHWKFHYPGTIPECCQRNMEALAFPSQTGPSDARARFYRVLERYCLPAIAIHSVCRS